MLQGFSLQYLHFQTVSSPLHLQWAISAGETGDDSWAWGLRVFTVYRGLAPTQSRRAAQCCCDNKQPCSLSVNHEDLLQLSWGLYSTPRPHPPARTQAGGTAPPRTLPPQGLCGRGRREWSTAHPGPQSCWPGGSLLPFHWPEKSSSRARVWQRQPGENERDGGQRNARKKASRVSKHP